MGAVPRRPERGEGRRTPVGVWIAVGTAGCLALLSCGGILAAMAAITSSNLLRAGIAANETAVLQAMSTIRAAEFDAKRQAFQDSNGDGVGEYLSLSTLEAFSPAVLNLELSRGTYRGFRYQIAVGPAGSTWDATAVPEQYRVTGVRVFYVDETGVVRAQDTGGSSVPDRAVARGFPALGG